MNQSYDAGVPLLFRSAVQYRLRGQATLPAAMLDVHPTLWITYAWNDLETAVPPT